MLVLALLGCLAFPASGHLRPEDSQATPERSVAAVPEDELTRLSLEELLARQPGKAWDEPEVQELKRRVDAGTLGADAWRTLLTGRVIHARARWPVGEPLLLWIEVPAWLPYARIAVRAVEPDLGEIEADNRTPSRCATCQLEDLRQQRRLRMAPLPAGTHRLKVDVLIEQSEGRFGRDRGSHLVWRGELTLPIEAVDSLEQAMPPCSVPEVNADLRNSLRVIEWNGLGGVKCLGVTLDGEYDRLPALRGLAVSANLQVRYRGEVREEVRITTDGRRGGWYGSGKFDHLSAEMADEGFDMTGWELTVTGVPDGVLPIWEADRWWNGSVSMPLAEALRAPKDR